MELARGRLAGSPSGSGAVWPACNLFRHKLTPDLFCVVPQDCPVPGFLEGSTWTFTGTVSENTPGPTGFDRRAAAAGGRLNSFFIFQARSAEPRPGGAQPSDAAPSPTPTLALRLGPTEVQPEPIRDR